MDPLPHWIRIRLEDYEIYMGCFMGIMRRVMSMKGKLVDNISNNHPGWNIDIEAVLGEIAFAKWRGAYWDGAFNTFKRPDVENYQVRQAHLKRDRVSLIVRPGDNKKECYVCVTGTSPIYYICGWIYGHEAERDEHKDNPGGLGSAWFFPVQQTHDMKTLPEV